MLKKCEVNKKQHYCMCEQSFHINLGQEVVHQKFNRLSLSTTLNLSVSVDKRDTMRLYNKLHRNITKVIARGFV